MSYRVMSSPTMTRFSRRQAGRLRESPIRMCLRYGRELRWLGGETIVKAATFRVGKHVRISKEKMRFAKAVEQNFNTEILKVAKVIDRRL